MDRLLLVTAGLAVVLVLMVLISVRRAHIRVEYSTSWLGGALALLVLSQSRGALEWLAPVLGVVSPPLVLVLLAGCVFLLIFYRFSVILSQLKDHNVALAQRVAILEYRLEAAEGIAAPE